MRLANLDGRATIVTDDGVIDIAHASGGALPSDLDHAIANLDRIRVWFDTTRPKADASLTAPICSPNSNASGHRLSAHTRSSPSD
ncbi:hypothetical protein [Nocardia sp. SC052]|uniref:hypothetical protein n=1 Tax=Nocardia sichangensis TaxID=3385975 RepID=UPI0039A0B157